MTSKEKLIKTVDHLTEEQAQFLLEQTQTFGNCFYSKGDLMRALKIDGTGKIDTALPTPYVNQVKEVLPSFNTSFNVMDYREKSFGEVTNIAEAYIKKLHEVFHVH